METMVPTTVATPCNRTSGGQGHVRTALIAIVAVVAGCNGGSAPPKSGPDASTGTRSLAATAWPVQYLAGRIAGGQPAVELVAQPRDPQQKWYPDAASIARLQSATLIFTNGAGYEPWLQSVTIPSARVADTTAPWESDLIPITGERVHQHGPEGARTKSQVASQTWLDPGLAIKQAQVIRDRLIESFPDRSAEFQKNFESLNSDLIPLQRALRETSGNRASVTLVDPANVFSYLVRAAGVAVTPVSWTLADLENADSPTDQFAVLAESAGVLVLIPHDASSALDTTLSDRGIGFVRLESLESPPESGDYLTAMQTNVQRLQDAITAVK